MRARQRRWTRVQSEILVWAGDEPLELFYDAQSFWVPPIDKIAKVGTGSPYRLPAATSKSGIPLPGTAVIEDVVGEDPGGGTRTLFSVKDFCAFLERDMPELFERGFDIVSDPEQVRQAQTEGRPLYEESLDVKAKEVIDQELARRKQLEDSGRPVTAASNEKEVVWAFRHRQKRGTAKPSISTADLFAAASGVNVPNAQQIAETLPIASPVGKNLLEECEALNLNLTKTELLALLRDDKEQMGVIIERIALRKKQLSSTSDEPAAAEGPF